MNFNVWLLPCHFELPFVSKDLLARNAFILAKVKDSEHVMGGEKKHFPDMGFWVFIILSQAKQLY